MVAFEIGLVMANEPGLTRRRSQAVVGALRLRQACNIPGVRIPLLAPNELFSSLTVGSFGDIEIEYGDDGKPSIVGARPDGHPYRKKMRGRTSNQLHLPSRT